MSDERPLTPKQSALKALALRQMESSAETLKHIAEIPNASRADSEAVTDAADWLAKADDCLRNWFGGCPDDAPQ